ncbi:MAG TPA: hypothetical protein VM285_04535 [Polyangia bacterium]|nr:hypothetical protein [Polyangia bacterium]
MMKNDFYFVLAASAWLFLGCGASCPEQKAALDATAAVTGDVTRVNELVAKREAAMGEAEQGGDTFRIQRLKFSVTAWELAIGTQARIIKASPQFEDAPSYGEAAGLINEFRCFLDKLLAHAEHTVSDGMGKALRGYKVEIERQLGRDGAVSPNELRNYYENGIPVTNPEEDQAAEEEPLDAGTAEDEDPGKQDD